MSENANLFAVFRTAAYFQAAKLIKDSASREKYQIYLSISADAVESVGCDDGRFISPKECDRVAISLSKSCKAD